MRLLALALLASLLIVPLASAEQGVHKCYGNTTAGACIDYYAINDFCVTARAAGTSHQECVIFIGPPP